MQENQLYPTMEPQKKSRALIYLAIGLGIIIFIMLLASFLFSKQLSVVLDVKSGIITEDGKMIPIYVYVMNPSSRTFYADYILVHREIYENNVLIINDSAIWDESLSLTLDHVWNYKIPPFTKTLISDQNWFMKSLQVPSKAFITYTVVTRRGINLTSSTTLTYVPE